MTLYEFNRLTKEEQISTVWSKGVFIDNHISETETLSCYAIDMFFEELLYDLDKNKIVKVRSFKSGHLLDKNSPNFKIEYLARNTFNFKIFCKR